MEGEGEMSALKEFCLAHGLWRLHLRAGGRDEVVPAAFYDAGRSSGEGIVGEEALRRAGPRVRRVARWDGDGWATWWVLLGRMAGPRPVVAALPALAGEKPLHPSAPEVPPTMDLPAAYVVPPTVALRAAAGLERGTALYLGALAWEVAAFDGEDMAEPCLVPGGLDPLYRTIIRQYFQQERRPLLPVQVPALLREGFPFEEAGLLNPIVPHLEEGPVLLGGEDAVVNAALARALEGQGHPVQLAEPLDGLERLACAAAPLAGGSQPPEPPKGGLL